MLFGIVFLKNSQALPSDLFAQVDQTHWVLDLAQQGVVDYPSVRDVCVFLTAGAGPHITAPSSSVPWRESPSRAPPGASRPRLPPLVPGKRSFTPGRRADGARASGGVGVGVPRRTVQRDALGHVPTAVASGQRRELPAGGEDRHHARTPRARQAPPRCAARALRRSLAFHHGAGERRPVDAFGSPPLSPTFPAAPPSKPHLFPRRRTSPAARCASSRPRRSSRSSSPSTSSASWRGARPLAVAPLSPPHGADAALHAAPGLLWRVSSGLRPCFARMLPAGVVPDVAARGPAARPHERHREVRPAARPAPARPLRRGLPAPDSSCSHADLSL